MFITAYFMPPAASSASAPLPVRRALRDLAGHIQAWRKLRGLTQEQLADRAGVARQTVIRLERGDGVISLEIVLRVFYALGILDSVPRAVDPYESDVGRLRAEERLPRRVRPRDLRRSGRA
jgi:transcriptional regulator with XRE-family HTH domain